MSSYKVWVHCWCHFIARLEKECEADLASLYFKFIDGFIFMQFSREICCCSIFLRAEDAVSSACCLFSSGAAPGPGTHLAAHLHSWIFLCSPVWAPPATGIVKVLPFPEHSGVNPRWFQWIWEVYFGFALNLLIGCS